MKHNNRKAKKGFTLVEILLVLIIVSAIVMMTVGYLQQRTLNMRINRAALQMQQILNAGMAYYVANGSWPGTLACLQGLGGANCTGTVQYLPTNLTSPFGQAYTVLPQSATPQAQLYVYTPITTATASGTVVTTTSILSGKLPLAYTTKTAPAAPNPPANDGTCTTANNPTTCYVVASVNIPGQNLNNATAVNFAGVYKNGACVPVPTCPVDKNGNTMTPEIIVALSSVSGNADTGQYMVYPLSSFTAYATGPSATPPVCQGDAWAGGSNTNCYSNATGGALLPAGNYWRVCVEVTTVKGGLGWGSDTSSAFNSGYYEQVVAMTRCAVNNEPSGSGFNVYTP